MASDWRDLLGWQTDAEKRLAQELYESADGQMPRIGLIDRALGVNTDDIEQQRDRIQRKDLGSTYNAQLIANGENAVALGEDSATVMGRVARGQKKTKEDNTKAQVELHERLQGPSNRRADRAQDLQAQQMSDSMTLAIMNQQENTALRREDMMMRKEQARKEDLRYNERMDELDRKDRRAMMQNMAMGLASLGAAFAL